MLKELKSWINRENKPGTPLWKTLLLEHRLPWRYLVLFGRINLFLLKKNKELKKILENNKEDITVIIGVKNRYDHKIINALRSIRNQDYNQNLIKMTIVDYDSKKELIQKFKKLCESYNADYIRVDDKQIWNRSHCLNIGIKNAKTKYILTSDVDIVFEKNYIKEGIKALKEYPFQVILCPCTYSKKGDFNQNTDILKEYNSIKKRNTSLGEGHGINMTLRYSYYKIRGYDEQYKVWGREDDDLIKRFLFFGLNQKDIGNKTSYLHQWHPRLQGVKIKGYKKQIEKNKKYHQNNNSIIRNKNGWGKIK